MFFILTQANIEEEHNIMLCCYLDLYSFMTGNLHLSKYMEQVPRIEKKSEPPLFVGTISNIRI